MNLVPHWDKHKMYSDLSSQTLHGLSGPPPPLSIITTSTPPPPSFRLIYTLMHHKICFII